MIKFDKIISFERDSFWHSESLSTRIKDMVRPIVAGANCLIVIGY